MVRVTHSSYVLLIVLLFLQYMYYIIVKSLQFCLQGNAIYNVLPDIISNLSDPQKSIPQETFRSIVK